MLPAAAQQPWPPVGGDHRSVYDPVLDRGAGGGLVVVAVNVEGPFSLFEALLQLGGGGRPSRDAAG
jgi:hypothetical protein